MLALREKVSQFFQNVVYSKKNSSFWTVISQIRVPVKESIQTCMCTKGRGTNSEKPPVFLARFLKWSKCLALDHNISSHINQKIIPAGETRDTDTNCTRCLIKICDEDLPVVRPIKVTEHDSWRCTESYPMCRFHNLQVSAQWIWHGRWQQEWAPLMVITLQCTKN